MAETFKQPSFAKGELSPDLQGRVDTNLYGIALGLQRNWITMRGGGVQTRAGTKYIGRVKKSSNGQVRIIPFTFSQSVTFNLEFGNLYVRFVKNGAQVTKSSVNIIAITQAAKSTISVASTPSLTNGDEIILSGIGGMTQLNGRNVLVTNVNNGAGTFQIQDLDGNFIDTTNFTAYTSGGTMAAIYELTTPYVTADLQQLNFVQSANVMTVTHQNYPPADIARVSDNSWTYTAIVFKPGIDGPTVTFATASGNSGTLSYQVTAISALNEESLPGLGTAVNVTAFSEALPGVVTLTVPAHGLSNGATVLVKTSSTNQTVTQVDGVTNGVGGVVIWTITAHGYTNGDQVFIGPISSLILTTGSPPGPIAPNPPGQFPPTIANQSYTVANVTANTFTLNGITAARAVIVAAANLATISQPYIDAYANQNWVIANVTANTFQLAGATATGTFAIAAVPAGKATITTNSVSHATSGAPTSTAPNILTWTAVTGAIQYNIYVSTNGIYGYIGTTAGLTFSDVGITASALNNPPIANNPFNSPGNYPAVVCYYQQRLCFANTINNVATFWGSRAGFRTNFTVHLPSQSGDSIQFTLVGNNQVNPIVGLMDCRYLMLFTAAGEWAAFGNTSGILDPTTSFGVVQSSSYGSSGIRPLLVNAEVLYVQGQGGAIRNLEYQFYQNNFRGEDLTLPSNHLFENFTITDWAYQKAPYQIIWAVRSDGTLLSFTYVKDEQVKAWAHHDFTGTVTPTAGALPLIVAGGTVENISALPEGNETALYLVVNRSGIRTIERMSSRLISNISDVSLYNQMDLALSFDGTGPTTTSMQFSNGQNYTYSEHLILTASVATFTAANVGDAYFIYTVPTVSTQPLQEVRFVVDQFLNTTQVMGHVQGEPVPPSLVTGSSTNWARAVNKVAGLWHLKNQAVSVFANAYVAGNPFNNFYKTLYIVDANGNLTLDSDKWYSKITVGLPVTCDIQTLDLSTAAAEAPAYEKMIVASVSFMMRETRGMWAGTDQPPADAYGSVDTSQTNLERLPTRDTDTDGYDQPPQLQITNRERIPIQGKWTKTGRSLIRVTDPLPATILQVSVNGSLPPRNPQRQ